MIDPQIRASYLELLRRDLTQYGMRERMPEGWPLRKRLLLGAVNAGNAIARRSKPFGLRSREFGWDWPPTALTMIGMRRLESLQHCVEKVLAENIPGDLVECGVWRGGASILMRAVLAAYGDHSRTVWLADSFQGLPRPNGEAYKPDRYMQLHRYSSILGVPQEEVAANFARYGLLDEQVRFLPGWFKDTLRDAPIDAIAVLRLDGDMYESTIQSLDALYPRLSPGGVCVVDDYNIPTCRQAVVDYRARHGITDPIVDIDGCGAFWTARSTDRSQSQVGQGPQNSNQ